MTIFFYIDHKPEDPQERTRIEKAGYKVTLDGRVSGLFHIELYFEKFLMFFRWS